MDNTSVFRGILIIFFIAVLIFLVNDYTTKANLRSGNGASSEGFENTAASYPFEDASHERYGRHEIDNAQPARPNEPAHASKFKKVDYKKPESKSCFPKDKLTAEDLLPKDAANSRWAQVNPAGQGDVKDKNFLNAGFHMGINTVGTSLRNANLQLRSEPPNPQVKVSPWNQTTIESDLNRRPLEIGGCD